MGTCWLENPKSLNPQVLNLIEVPCDHTEGLMWNTPMLFFCRHLRADRKSRRNGCGCKYLEFHWMFSCGWFCHIFQWSPVTWTPHSYFSAWQSPLLLLAVANLWNGPMYRLYRVHVRQIIQTVQPIDDWWVLCLVITLNPNQYCWKVLDNI